MARISRDSGLEWGFSKICTSHALGAALVSGFLPIGAMEGCLVPNELLADQLSRAKQQPRISRDSRLGWKSHEIWASHALVIVLALGFVHVGAADGPLGPQQTVYKPINQPNRAEQQRRISRVSRLGWKSHEVRAPHMLVTVLASGFMHVGAVDGPLRPQETVY